MSFISCQKGNNTINDDVISSISFAWSPKKILVNEPVTFTFIDETTVADNIEFNWDFGEEHFSKERTPVYTYHKVGDYVVTATVDFLEESNTVSKLVKVSFSNDISNRETLRDRLKRTGDEILVCAHRTHHENAPENSLKGIQNAIDVGIEIVEIDIRATKDSELVVLHDATVDRTTNGNGSLNDFTLLELEQFNLYQGSLLTSEKIPSLKEVLELSRGKIFLNLDIDNKASFNKVYELVDQYGMLKQVMFYTKNDVIISNAIKTDSSVVVMPYINNKTTFNSYSNSGLNLDVVHYSSNSFNTDLINKAENQSWTVYANVYVNSDKTPTSDSYTDVNNFIELHGGVVQTDYPSEIINYLTINKNETK